MEKEKSDLGKSISKEYKQVQFYMCRTCKFNQDNICTKGRDIMVCNHKGLKNKE